MYVGGGGGGTCNQQHRRRRRRRCHRACDGVRDGRMAGLAWLAGWMDGRTDGRTDGCPFTGGGDPAPQPPSPFPLPTRGRGTMQERWAVSCSPAGFLFFLFVLPFRSFCGWIHQVVCCYWPTGVGAEGEGGRNQSCSAWCRLRRSCVRAVRACGACLQMRVFAASKQLEYV